MSVTVVHMTIGTIILGIMGIIAGILIIIYAYQIQTRIMPFSMVEKFLGPGSGTLGYKLLGIVFIIFSVGFMFGFIKTSPTQTTTTNNKPQTTITQPQSNTGGGTFAQ
jgi:hypothetical protein